MTLRSNLPRLRKLAGAAERMLDVGGGYQPFNLATHVVDLMPHATWRTRDALDLGRSLTEGEGGLGFFWKRGFTCEEVFGAPRENYSVFRRKALARLTGR